MSKIVLFTLIFSATSLLAAAQPVDVETAIKALRSIYADAKNHVTEYNELEKDYIVGKYDLKKDQKLEELQSYIEYLNNLMAQGSKITSEIVWHRVMEKINACKKHLEEWQKFCTKHHEASIKLYNKTNSTIDNLLSTTPNNKKLAAGTLEDPAQLWHS